MVVIMRLSKKEIAEQAGYNEGQVRYWIDKFSEYFVGYKEQGMRWQVYDNDAIDKVKIIGEMIQSASHDDIRRALDQAGYSPTIEMVELSTSKGYNDTTTTMTLIEARALLELLEVQREIIDHQSEVIKELRRQIETLNK